MAKLALFAAAGAASGVPADRLATCMVQLDNRGQQDRGRNWGDYPHYEGLRDKLAEYCERWPSGVLRATLVILREDGPTFYRNLAWPGAAGLARKRRLSKP